MKLPRILDNDQGGDHQKETVIMSHHERYTMGQTTGGLTVLFTVMCIVDLFGVFPVITLPKSVISCGIYGIPLVCSVIGLQLYTAVLLGRSWLLAQELCPHISEKNRFPYPAVAELAFGPKARKLVIFLIDATVFGSGIPNFILASQSLQIFWWKISGGSIGVTYCIWMLLLALLLCPVMWLGSPKDMKPLALASVFIVSTVAVSTWTCILQDDESPMPVSSVLAHRPHLEDFLIAYGILAFQFDIHPMLLTLQVDMKDSKKVNAAVLGGFAATGLMSAVTTILAANRYGLDVDNNILQGIPSSIPLYLVALLVTFQLCLSSAVGNSALFQHIEDFFKVPRDFCYQRCLVRSSIVAVAVFLAESVPRFDLVMGLVGSTLTGPLMFIFPPLFFLKLCYMKTHLTRGQRNNNLFANSKYNAMMNGKQNGAFEAERQNGVPEAEIQNGVHNNGVQSGVLENGKQNGVDGAQSNVPLIFKMAYTKYNTFTRCNEYAEDEYAVVWYDILLALIVMTMGISATIVAAYSSWSNSIAYATFSPPCLMNATEAARSFLKEPMGPMAF